MQRLPTILVLLATILVLPARAAESLCNPAEQTFFSCSVANSAKVASVCGARNTSANDGYLQYRFGLPGKIEFEYPANRSGSAKLFGWDSRVHLDVADDWLWFKNGGFVYSVFFIENHDISDGKPVFRTGVMVEKKGDEKAAKTLKCAQRATGDFKRLADIVEWKEVDD